MQTSGREQRELEEKKEIFQKQCPVVSRQLASYLGRHQAQSQDHRLFADQEMDLAVWAHARAHARNDEDSQTDIPEGLRSASDLIAPLMPPPMDWGATSHFQDKVIASFDSPIIHAWLYQDEKKRITEAVLVGRGIPNVRAQLIAATFSCFFAIDPHINNFILDGFIRLSAAKGDLDGEAQERVGFFQRLLLPLKGPHKAEIMVPKDAEEAMTLLQGSLKRLQERTSFVQLHLVPAQQASSLQQTLSEYRRRASKSDDVFLWQGNEADISPPVVTSLPYQRFSGLGPAVRIELSSDLLDSPIYRELSETYHAALVEDILEDVRRRERFYAEMLEQHKDRLEWFRNLSPKEQSQEPDVITDVEIDYETGLTIRLAVPGRVPAREFYTSGMQYKIGKDTEWLAMMRRLQSRIDKILHHETAPLRRFIAARLFDAAIRDLALSEAPSASSLFQRWKQVIQPLLWLECRRFFAREGISAEDICTSHTIFNLAVDEGNGRLLLFPHSLVDSARSIILMDRNRQVNVVLDPTDDAEQLQAPPDSPAASRLYEETHQLAQQGVSSAQLKSKLKEALLRDPELVMQRLADEWMRSSNEGPKDFDRLKMSALLKEGSVHAALGALRWCNELCFQSADEVLKRVDQSIQHPTVTDAAAVLMRGYLNCRRAGYDPAKALGEILTGHRVDPALDEASTLIWNANRLCPEMVNQFVRQGVLAPTTFLPLDAPRASLEEQGAIASLAAIEAAKAAIAIDGALASLNASQETRRSAFYKIVPAIEECLGLQFAAPPSALDALLELLVGEKKSGKVS